jgi:hypothetical protein
VPWQGHLLLLWASFGSSFLSSVALHFGSYPKGQALEDGPFPISSDALFPEADP